MINKAILVGRLARDPSLKEFDGGGAICAMRVITSRVWKDRKTGELREKADGHNVSIQIAPVARRASETLAKGSLVYVEGSFETRKWTDAEGQDRYITEIVVRPYNGTFRRLSSNSSYAQQGAGNAPDRHEDEIDYMSELTTGEGGFSLGGADLLTDD